MRGAGFEEVDADAVAAAQNRARVDAEATQFLHAGVAEIVFREARDEGGLVAEEREGDGDIGFTAAEGHFQHRRLREAKLARGRQTHHDFPERDNFHLNLSCLDVFPPDPRAGVHALEGAANRGRFKQFPRAFRTHAQLLFSPGRERF